MEQEKVLSRHGDRTAREGGERRDTERGRGWRREEKMKPGGE